jgi:chromosome segregation ATPase
MTQANPQLWQVIGDLLVKNMDWPGAEDMAKRLKLTLLPEVQAEVDKQQGEPEIPPQMQQAMQQMQQQIEGMGQALNNASQQVDGLEAEIAKREQALMQEQAKRMKVEIDLQRTQAMDEVSRAQHELVMSAQAADGVPESQVKAQLEMQRLELERFKAQLDAETRVLVAQIAAQAKEVETPAETLAEGGIEEPNPNAAVAAAMAGFTQALAEMRAPRTIIRGPDGRAQGIV